METIKKTKTKKLSPERSKNNLCSSYRLKHWFDAFMGLKSSSFEHKSLCLCISFWGRDPLLLNSLAPNIWKKHRIKDSTVPHFEQKSWNRERQHTQVTALPSAKKWPRQVWTPSPLLGLALVLYLPEVQFLCEPGVTEATSRGCGRGLRRQDAWSAQDVASAR